MVRERSRRRPGTRVPAVGALVGLVALAGALGLSRAATGPLVRTVTLAQPPLSVVLDRRVGRAFIASSDAAAQGDVSVIDLGSGVLVATVPLGPGVRDPVVAVDEQTGRAFVSDAQSRRVSVLDAGSGRRVRSVRVGPHPGPPLVDARAGRVLVVDDSTGSLWLLDARSGRLLHRSPLGLRPSGLALDARRGRLFVGTLDGTLRVLDTRTGALLRTIAIPTPVAEVAVDARAGRVVVLGAGDASVYVLAASSGRLLRRVPVGLLPAWVSVDAGSGRAIIGDNRTTTLRLLRTRDGVALPLLTLAQAPGPLVGDARTGRVFVLSQGTDSVTVLDARSGTLRRTVTVDPAGAGQTSAGDAIALDDRHHQVLVASDTGRTARVTVLDARSGAVVRRITVPVVPLALAVDAGTGRAVVAGPLLPQRSPLAALRADVAGLLGMALPHRGGWGLWSGRHTAGAPAPGSGVSVLDVAR